MIETIDPFSIVIALYGVFAYGLGVYAGSRRRGKK